MQPLGPDLCWFERLLGALLCTLCPWICYMYERWSMLGCQWPTCFVDVAFWYGATPAHHTCLTGFRQRSLLYNLMQLHQPPLWEGGPPAPPSPEFGGLTALHVETSKCALGRGGTKSGPCATSMRAICCRCCCCCCAPQPPTPAKLQPAPRRPQPRNRPSHLGRPLPIPVAPSPSLVCIFSRKLLQATAAVGVFARNEANRTMSGQPVTSR